MYQQKKNWRRARPSQSGLKLWWRKKLSVNAVDECFCTKCGRAYQSDPVPKHVEDFVTGNASVFVYPAGTWKRKGLVVKVGRWRFRSGKHYPSEFFDPEELNDLAKSLVKAHRYIQTVNASSRRDRRHRTG